MTYKELLDEVSRFAWILTNKGIKKGDTIIIYMPMIIETAVCILACARIGAVHSVVFGGFSSKELSKRILDSNPKAILSASCGLEPHKKIFYPKMIREAKEIVNQSKMLTIYYDRKQEPIKSC